MRKKWFWVCVVYFQFYSLYQDTQWLKQNLVVAGEAPGKENIARGAPHAKLVKVNHGHTSVGLDVELIVSREDIVMLGSLVEGNEFLKDSMCLCLEDLEGLVHLDAVHLVLERLSVPGSRHKEKRKPFAVTEAARPLLFARLLLCVQ